MGEYQQSGDVQASPDAVFAFVSDVRNLPKYLPSVRQAEPEQQDRVSIQGKAQGHDYNSDGYYTVDQGTRRMEWGSDGEEHYTGWLQVQGNGDSASNVTVHLSFTPNQQVGQKLQQATGDQDETIQRDLVKAIDSIKNLCEGQGGKVE